MRLGLRSNQQIRRYFCSLLSRVGSETTGAMENTNQPIPTVKEVPSQIDLGLNEPGIDTDGMVYKNAKDMWARQIESRFNAASQTNSTKSKIIGDINNWYSNGLKYWEVNTS